MIFPRILLLCTLTILLSSCANIFLRAERIFFAQHSVSTALYLSIGAAEEDGDMELAEKLYEAEDILAGACSLFQRKGYQQLDAKTGGTGENLVKNDPAINDDPYKALDDCEAVSKEIEELIWQTYPDIASDYFVEQQ